MFVLTDKAAILHKILLLIITKLGIDAKKKFERKFSNGQPYLDLVNVSVHRVI